MKNPPSSLRKNALKQVCSWHVWRRFAENIRKYSSSKSRNFSTLLLFCAFVLIIISLSGQLGHGYGGSIMLERSLSTETSTSTRHSQVLLTVISRSTTDFGTYFVICAFMTTNVLRVNNRISIQFAVDRLVLGRTDLTASAFINGVTLLACYFSF